MKSRFPRALLCMLLVVALIGSNVLVSHSADYVITDLGRLGISDLSHYNGIVFDYFESAQADVEGALAIGGQSKIGTTGQYDVGASAHHPVMGTYTNPNNYPSLLLGDATTIGKSSGNSYINVYGGPVVMQESYEQTYYQKPTRFYAAKGTEFARDSVVDSFFERAYASVTKTVENLNNAHSNPAGATIKSTEFTGYWNASGWPLNNSSGFSVFEPDQFLLGGTAITPGKDIVVVNITSPQHLTIGEVKLSKALMEYDMVVLNFPDAQSVTFSGGATLIGGAIIDTGANISGKPEQNKLLAQYSSTLVWNFPRAKSIQTTTYGVIGSVLAPYAYVEGGGGSINGMLVADSFKTVGGMELHSFKMRRPVFDNEGEDPVPEILGKLQLVKYDIDFPQMTLGGASFVLEWFDPDKPAGQNWTEILNASTETTASGTLYLEDLPLGRYRISEITAPDGYDITTGLDQYEFELTAEHSEEALVIRASNTRKPTPQYDVEFLKTGEGNAPLPGATFTIYYRNGASLVPVGERTSDQSGCVLLDGMIPGQYLMVETTAPDGYLPTDKYWEITVADSGGVVTITVDEYDDAILTTSYPYVPGTTPPIEIENEPDLPNDPDFDVIVVKTDSIDGSLLEGAEYTLYRKNTPSGAPIVPGSLELPEEQETPEVPGEPGGEGPGPEEDGEPAEGAQEPDDFPEDHSDDDTGSEGADDGDSPPDGDSQPDGDGLFQFAEGELEEILPISDRESEEQPEGESDSGEEEPPVKPADSPVTPFATTWEPWPDLSSATQSTGADGRAVFEDLPPGEYRLIETKAPDGYDLDPIPYDFTLDADSPIHYIVITRENTPIGEIVVEKVEKGSSTPLTGAEFALYREVEQATNFEDRWVKVETATAINGSALTFQNLRPGTYYLLETRAPDGYKLDQTPIGPFTIGSDADGQSDFYEKTVRVENEPILYTRNFQKIGIDTDDTAITNDPNFVGVVFDLYKFSFSSLSWGSSPISTHTLQSADGKFQIDKLTPGLYRLVERVPPDGYEAASSYGTIFYITENSEEENDPLDAPIHIYNLKGDSNVLTDLLVKKWGDIDKYPTLYALEGAAFNLYKQYDTINDPLDVEYYELLLGWVTTDQNGDLLLKDLSPGNYRLVEIEAPPGYELDYENLPIFNFTVTGTGAITTDLSNLPDNMVFTSSGSGYILEVTNYAVTPFVVTIVKRSTENGNTEALKDAVFDLYKEYQTAATMPEILPFGLDEGIASTSSEHTYWGIYKRVTSDSQGYIAVDPITVGRYMLEEVAPPTGYETGLVSKYVFEVTEEDGEFFAIYAGLEIPSDSELSFSIPNAPVTPATNKGGFTVKKVDSVTGQPLSDVQFLLSFEKEIPTLSGGSQSVTIPQYYERLEYRTIKWTPVREDARVFVTDDDGKITVNWLDPNSETFYLHELSTRDGYTPLAEPVVFKTNISATGTQLELLSDNARWTLENGELVLLVANRQGGGGDGGGGDTWDPDPDGETPGGEIPGGETPGSESPGGGTDPGDPNLPNPYPYPDPDRDSGTASGSDELDKTPNTGYMDSPVVPMALAGLSATGAF